MKPPLLPVLGLAAMLAVATLAAANVAATTAARSDAWRGREGLGDGRAMPVGGLARRPAVVIGAQASLALAAARDNRIAR